MPDLVAATAIAGFFVLFGLMVLLLLRQIDKDASRVGAEERMLIAMQYADDIGLDECKCAASHTGIGA